MSRPLQKRPLQKYCGTHIGDEKYLTFLKILGKNAFLSIKIREKRSLDLYNKN